MSKVLGFLKGILISIWVLFAIGATICLISLNEYGISEMGDYCIFIIDSERLEPDFMKNDLVITKKVSQNKYKEGDNAFFYLENPFDEVFINYGKITKIVAADHAESSYYFGEKDIVAHSTMMGRADDAKVYHKWGLVLSIFESKWGFMFLVIFPTIFAIVYEVYSIIEEARHERHEE